MGRKKLPAAVKKFRRNPGKGKIGQSPREIGGEIQMPRNMDPRAQKIWKRVLPRLKQMGVMSVVDQESLARYCQYCLIWEDAMKHILEHGIVMAQGQNNYLAQNPSVTVLNKADVNLRSYESRFGMDPSSRSTLQIDGDQSPDESLDEFKLVGT